MPVNTKYKSHYKPIYQRIIDRKQNGLKLVPGGTGLGKTEGIPHVVEEHSKDDERKFIYIANRVQLLNEMANKFYPHEVVHLENDTETLLKLAERQANGLTSFDELFEDYTFNKYVNYLSKTQNNYLDIRKAKNHVSFFTRYSGIIKDNPNDDTIRSKVTQLMYFFQPILIAAKQQEKIPPNEEFDLTQNDYKELVELNAIKKLFPYIEFKQNPNVRLLLLTVQKGFFGFFDGQRKNINLTSLEKENGNNIIFLDEFDFLENDLLTRISEDYAIEDPFDLVSIFYQRIRKNKLPLQSYPYTKEIRDEIEGIINKIESLRTRHGINFPEIGHFICKDENKEITGRAIFQTSYSIVNKRIYLNPDVRENSFDLCTDSSKKSAFTLINIVNSATADIIRLFKELELSHPTIYQEVVRHCFSHTDYVDALRQVRQVARKSKRQNTNYGEIMDNGFGLYEVEGGSSRETDPDEVRFNYYSIFSTPEKVLLQLCKNNLVFGLSATANIERTLKNFDLTWLQKQSSKEGIFHYFDFSDEDKRDIKQANKEKYKARGENRAILDKARYLSYDDPMAEFINAYTSGWNKYYKLRIDLFFATLKWIAENNKSTLRHNTHLLFFSSYDQIKTLFYRSPINEDKLYFIERKSHPDVKNFEWFEIEYLNTRFRVVFYDAALGRRINSDKTTHQLYHGLFWDQVPVVVVTTYPSAGNGVNVQYYDGRQGYLQKDEKSKKDFTHVHLLDSPYYYFGQFQSGKNYQERTAILKQNIYNIAKLKEAKKITPEQFKAQLNSIRKIDYFNNAYLATEDGLLNQISVYIQALGRIERVWSLMENQTVRLAEDIYKEFQEFCCHEDFEYIRDEIDGHISNNMRELFRLIKEDSRRIAAEIADLKEETLESQNKKSIDAIAGILGGVEAFRRNPAQNQEAKQSWVDLRQDALKHEFESSLLRSKHCVYDTNYLCNGMVYINGQKHLVPHKLWNSNYSQWDLNGIYNAVNANDVIRNHFKIRGYELEFSDCKKMFTPYFYQAILCGAIGEEAIKAIFREERIELNDEEISDYLFEVIDTKIEGKPWYIDCKNYSEQRLKYFELSKDDPLWHPKLNDKQFKETAVRKLSLIENFNPKQKDDCKIIYMNFVSGSERLRRYFDKQFNQVDFKNARIIIIQGVIDSASKNEYCPEFQNFINQVRYAINEDY